MFKKLFALLFSIMLLTGCMADRYSTTSDSNDTTTTTDPTTGGEGEGEGESEGDDQPGGGPFPDRGFA